jgi:hypothetical protein
MPNTTPNLRASGTIRTSRIVKMSGNHKGAEADANEQAIGISMQDGKYPPLNDLVTTNNHAETDDVIRLHGDGDICLLEAGGTWVAGDFLKSDADGKGVQAATSGTTMQNVVGIAQEGAASGEKRLVQVNIGTKMPA